MNRSTLILLALLIVLGVVAIFILPAEEERTTSYTAPAITFSVDSAAISRVEIRRPSARITIENIGGRWTITQPASYLADPVAVTQLIGSFANFRTGSLISGNPEKQALFQVDSSGTLVTLSDRGGTSSQIIIGKMGPSFSEVYFRLPGATEVYLGSGITTWSLNKEIKDWRDKTILAAPTEGVTSVSVATGARSKSYVKDSTGWTSGGAGVDNQTMNPILNTIGNLRADDFVDSLLDLRSVPGRVDVKGEVSATLQFHRMPGDTNKYIVQSSNSPQKFVVGKYIASRLFTEVGEPPAAPRRGREAPGSFNESASGAGDPAADASPAKPDAVGASGKTGAPAPVRSETPPAPSAGGSVNPFKQRPPGQSPPPPPPAGTTGTGAKAGAGAAAAPPPSTPSTARPSASGSADDEGDLTIHTVKQGETMTMISRQYGVTVDQIIKWNLLKSININPGQELYIFVRK